MRTIFSDQATRGDEVGETSRSVNPYVARLVARQSLPNRMMRSWSRVEMDCQYLRADYFRFFMPFQSMYLVDERWARNRNLTSNYLVDPVR